MDYTISLASVIALGADIVIGLLLPVGGYMFLYKKYRTHWKPFLVGGAVALLGGFMLVQMLNTLILSAPGVGAVIQGNPWLYGLCSAVVVALVEETARLWMYRGQLRDQQENDYNALMFGVGQGGLEAFSMLSVGMLNNYMVALAIYQGKTSLLLQGATAEELEAANAALTELIQKPPLEIWMLGVERISYTAVYLAMSVVVWFAAKKRQIGFPLFLLALGMRLVYQFVIAVMTEFGLSSVVVQGCACVLAAACVAAAVIVWRREHVPTPEETEE